MQQSADKLTSGEEKTSSLRGSGAPSTEEIQQAPEENADPEIEQQAPVEGEDLVVEDSGQIILEQIVNGVAADDRHKDFSKFPEEDSHEVKIRATDPTPEIEANDLAGGS